MIPMPPLMSLLNFPFISLANIYFPLFPSKCIWGSCKIKTATIEHRLGLIIICKLSFWIEFCLMSYANKLITHLSRQRECHFLCLSAGDVTRLTQLGFSYLILVDRLIYLMRQKSTSLILIYPNRRIIHAQQKILTKDIKPSRNNPANGMCPDGNHPFLLKHLNIRRFRRWGWDWIFWLHNFYKIWKWRTVISSCWKLGLTSCWSSLFRCRIGMRGLSRTIGRISR